MQGTQWHIQNKNKIISIDAAAFCFYISSLSPYGTDSFSKSTHFPFFTAAYRFLLIFSCICQMHSHSIKEQKRSCETEKRDYEHECLNINMAERKKEHKYVAVRKSFDIKRNNVKGTCTENKIRTQKKNRFWCFPSSDLFSLLATFFLFVSFHFVRFDGSHSEKAKENVGNWQKCVNEGMKTSYDVRYKLIGDWQLWNEILNGTCASFGIR